ncbi:39S ribosomal protein L33 [Schistosoma japonicum]|uniref:39S ribosomal protein L33 n=1 Tax=Schistosoma japonicum TaxID=6182 RepID=A0A4Z2D876_SCHJA|nr:39S ribosomal protein L33 [Schistosoma japonicum]
MSTPQGFIKTVMVLLESTSGSGHRIIGFRPRQATARKEKVAFDPRVQQNVLYREIRKIRTLKKAEH